MHWPRREMSGSRHIRAEIVISHLKGGLSHGQREALRTAIRMETPQAELTALQATTFVIAVLPGDEPLDAITQLDKSLNRALQVTGLSAVFDMSGRILQAGPSRQNEADRRRMRLRHTPGGRAFHVQARVTYLPGTLPEDDREALHAALRRDLPEVSLRVRPDAHNVVVITATLRADNAWNAVADLSHSLDDAFAGTGLFEVFDVTGREIHVVPQERHRSHGST